MDFCLGEDAFDLSGGAGASVFLRGRSPLALGVFFTSGDDFGEEFDLAAAPPLLPPTLRALEAVFDGGVGGLKLGGFSSRPEILPLYFLIKKSKIMIIGKQQRVAIDHAFTLEEHFN